MLEIDNLLDLFIKNQYLRINHNDDAIDIDHNDIFSSQLEFRIKELLKCNIECNKKIINNQLFINQQFLYDVNNILSFNDCSLLIGIV